MSKSVESSVLTNDRGEQSSASNLRRRDTIAVTRTSGSAPRRARPGSSLMILRVSLAQLESPAGPGPTVPDQQGGSWSGDPDHRRKDECQYCRQFQLQLIRPRSLSPSTPSPESLQDSDGPADSRHALTAINSDYSSTGNAEFNFKLNLIMKYSAIAC